MTTRGQTAPSPMNVDDNDRGDSSGSTVHDPVHPDESQNDPSHPDGSDELVSTARDQIPANIPDEGRKRVERILEDVCAKVSFQKNVFEFNGNLP